MVGMPADPLMLQPTVAPCCSMAESLKRTLILFRIISFNTQHNYSFEFTHTIFFQRLRVIYFTYAFKVLKINPTRHFCLWRKGTYLTWRHGHTVLFGPTLTAVFVGLASVQSCLKVKHRTPSVIWTRSACFIIRTSLVFGLAELRAICD